VLATNGYHLGRSPDIKSYAQFKKESWTVVWTVDLCKQKANKRVQISPKKRNCRRKRWRWQWLICVFDTPISAAVISRTITRKLRVVPRNAPYRADSYKRAADKEKELLSSLPPQSSSLSLIIAWFLRINIWEEGGRDFSA